MQGAILTEELNKELLRSGTQKSKFLQSKTAQTSNFIEASNKGDTEINIPWFSFFKKHFSFLPF